MHVSFSVTRRIEVQNKKVWTTGSLEAFPSRFVYNLIYHETNYAMFSMPLFFSSE